MQGLLRNLSTHTRSANLPTTSRRRRQATELVPCGALRQTSSRATYKYSNTVARHLLCGTRRVLVQSAADSSSNGLVLERLVSGKLNIDTAATQQLLYQAPATHHQGLKDASIVDVEAGLDKLLVLFSSSEVVQLLRQQPALLTAPLTAWLDFFSEFGFSNGQVKNLISQTPEVLVKGSLVTAGDAILHLKHLGFDNDEVRHRVVAYCPQVLMMQAADIDTLIALWSKFQVGVDERSGM